MAMTAEALKRLRIFQRPMCLISTSDDGKLKLEEEPLTDIEKIDMPLVVVAIAGLYRTRKSYLMNCLAGEKKGFPLGNTTESKTKGVWAWCRIHPKNDGLVLLLLDTEGLWDIAKGDQDHDNKIFTISALLCNVLVYNMMSAFNQDAVEKLTFISEMSKYISFAGGEIKKSDEKFDLILPIFVLCLRDFFLDLEKDGKEMTTDEYLEDCLELKAGKFNRPRECIRKYFPKRKCFTFDRPGNKLLMKRLETASTNELSEDFLEETEMFLKYIYSCKPKVLLSSKSLRGKMFATLATSYINAISSGAKLDVDYAIQMVATQENERMGTKSFFEGGADYKEVVLLEDKKLSEENLKRQFDKLKKDYHEAFTKQQNILEKKIEEQKQRTEEHYKRLESELEAYMRRIEEQMQLMMIGWEQQNELRKEQMKMMEAENEKLKQELWNEKMKLYAANTGRKK